MQVTRRQYEFCVLIPCYNNIGGLIRSLESIQYSSDDFFILIVDDGSKEAVSLDSIPGEIKKALYIKVITLKTNEGITAALNTGLQWIQNNTGVQYIARLDCGDICSPDRFQKQVDFFKKHPGTGLLGSWCIFRDPVTGAAYTYTTPLIHEEILKEMHLRNVFIHPTVMFSSEILKQHIFYPGNYPHAEDYAFFWTIIGSYKSAILDEPLVICEWNVKGISAKNRGKQLQSRKRIVLTFGTYKWLKLEGLLRLTLLSFLPSFLLNHLKMASAKRK